MTNYFPTRFALALTVCCVILSSGCASMNNRPLATVDYVDIDRFMGDWFVIAHIPARLERNAHNAIESYRLAADGSIETTYTFSTASVDGEKRSYHPRGFIHDRKSNAEWRMQFVWPFKAEYLIVYLDDDYTLTMVGRSKRDYLWIMSRQPKIPEATLQDLISRAEAMGYDPDRIRTVPQSWP
ncbi:MAG: lipocalin family protein [Chromatiales bacterium]|jgi:apolipoprotein D and lipocalin family protein